MKKRILYLIFSDSPSTIVRAKAFQQAFEKSSKYNVDYFYTYSTTIERFRNNVSKSRFFRFLLIIFRIIDLEKIGRRVKEKKTLRIIDKYDGIIVIKYVSEKMMTLLKDRKSVV